MQQDRIAFSVSDWGTILLTKMMTNVPKALDILQQFQVISYFLVSKAPHFHRMHVYSLTGSKTCFFLPCLLQLTAKLGEMTNALIIMYISELIQQFHVTSQFLAFKSKKKSSWNVCLLFGSKPHFFLLCLQQFQEKTLHILNLA